MTVDAEIARRSLIGAGLLLAAAPRAAWAASAASLRFLVYRGGVRVGDQVMRFSPAGEAMTVTAEASIVIRLGPVLLLRYSHQARETWRGGRFERLQTATSSNGKRERVAAERAAGGVTIETAGGVLRAPGEVSPFTHWNRRAFAGPMFNPQTGKLLKVSAVSLGADKATRANGETVAATRWSVRGEAEIDDWYDEAGTWCALRGRLPDRSIMEYRLA
jgi:hypothetical protein